MNGPEHYRAAEELLRTAESYDEQGLPYFSEDNAVEIAAAQVHALLGLAAATAIPATVTDPKWARPAWQDVLVSDTDRGRQENPDQQTEEEPF